MVVGKSKALCPKLVIAYDKADMWQRALVLLTAGVGAAL